MARSNLSIEETGKPKAAKPKKTYKFELGMARLITYCLGLAVALSWMFVLGVLVGRGTPLVSSMDLSVRAHVMRFLGLGREAQPPPENVADTWEDSKKMLQSLTYYDDLTKKGGAAITPAKPSGQQPSGSAAGSQAGGPSIQPTTDGRPTPSSPQGEPPAAQAANKPSPAQPLKEQGHPQPSLEHFTLLISSLREIENAHRLIEQLRSKGYSPRLDSLDLSESGRWNRVLIGSFPSRDEALQFAAEFNRKERMEGLVIRETD